MARPLIWIKIGGNYANFLSSNLLFQLMDLINKYLITEKCCLCTDIRTGGLILGIVNIVFSILLLLVNVAVEDMQRPEIITLAGLCLHTFHCHLQIECAQKEKQFNLYCDWYWNLFPFSVFQLILSACFVYGIVKVNKIHPIWCALYARVLKFHFPIFFFYLYSR